MQHPMRLVLLTPRYWPHTGEAELAAVHWSEGLAELDVRVTVLTGKWSPEWPDEFALRGVPVHRAAHAPLGGWSSYCYIADLSRWLRRHQSEFDVVCAMGLRHEAYAAISALAGKKPIVLHCQIHGPNGDCHWQAHARFGARFRRVCQRADGIVARSAAVADELRRAGYDATRITTIPLGTPAGEPRSADRRFAARAALADVNQDLAAAEYAPVAVYTGSLADTAGLSRLVEAWQPIARRWPSARLWLVGDGPARDNLFELISDLDIRYQVVMPGSFEDWTDVLQAADVFVWPSIHGGGACLVEAMAAGLPIVAADAPDRRAMMDHAVHGYLLPASDQAGWIDTLSRLFDAPRLAAELGAAAAKHAAAHYSRRRAAEEAWELFTRLRGKK